MGLFFLSFFFYNIFVKKKFICEKIYFIGVDNKMKKLVFCLFMIGVILNLCACTNSNSNDHVTKQEYDFQNDINEFRSNISAISFTYDEKKKLLIICRTKH